MSKASDVRVESARTLAGDNEVLGRLPLSPGHAEVLGDDARPPRRSPPLTGGQRLRSAAMQEPAAGKARLPVNQLAKAVVAEVVALGSLGEETACSQAPRARATTSSSLRPLTSRARSRSNGRPRTAAAASTCRAVLPGRATRVPRSPAMFPGSAHSGTRLGSACREILHGEQRKPVRTPRTVRSEIPGVGSLGKRRDVISGEPRQNDARERPRSAGLGRPGGRDRGPAGHPQASRSAPDRAVVRAAGAPR